MFETREFNPSAAVGWAKSDCVHNGRHFVGLSADHLKPSARSLFSATRAFMKASVSLIAKLSDIKAFIALGIGLVQCRIGIEGAYSMQAEDFSGWLSAIAGLSAATRGLGGAQESGRRRGAFGLEGFAGGEAGQGDEAQSPRG